MSLDNIARRFLYYPDRIPEDMPVPPWASGSEEVWMECEDGVRIHGLYFEGRDEEPVILFLHGNAQEVYSWSMVNEELSPLGCGLLIIDYRGYGKSDGVPEEEGLYMDGHSALGWLTDRGFDYEDIYIFGKSLGGAVACEIAQGLPLKGLILESTFTSLASVASRLFPLVPSNLPLGEEYDSINKLHRIRCPILTIHGDRDLLIPFSEGRALFEEAPEPKRFFAVSGAGHNDVSLVAGPEYARRIEQWMTDFDREDTA